MASQVRLNAYRIMWLFVFFDLPTNTKAERKDASKFRKQLLKDGFVMMQYSVYIRHCPSHENALMHKKRIKGFLPNKGFVSVLQITDKQYSLIQNFWGLQNKKPVQKAVPQLELF